MSRSLLLCPVRVGAAECQAVGRLVLMFKGNDFTFVGPPVDDAAILERVPADLGALLSVRNGFVCFAGGLHVRGAVTAPAWHSLRTAWEGESALFRSYPALLPSDVPFAQDCVGDQFLLRRDRVIRLSAETGETENTDLSLAAFFARCDEDPVGFLQMAPLQQLTAEGAALQPGQLIHAYPPFCTRESADGVSLRAVPIGEVLAVHAEFARAIARLENGERIRVVVE